ncbi:hypothetical protein [Candidatus Colwellia aromaticivorans]|uniref:hypothetical protein n=1 Tax=Candidatus Colwellia aromaticivorans TaxID=2267621 RepID=UPI000DF35194|nr:hypothetical protein [Candidatus Colwellia aromaticivorans]
MTLLDILNKEVNSNIKEGVPDWVSEKNASLKAYNIINELKLEKLTFIKKHSKVTDYRKKGNYQIKIQDIVRQMKEGRTGVFQSNSYSTDLKKYFKEINDELEKKMNARIKKKGGLLAKNKITIVKKAQSLQQEYDELKDKKLSEFYDDLIGKMPIKDKLKLGII